MKELMRTNDPVQISYVQSLLADEGLNCVVLDQHTSILEGSIGVLPQRIMVLDDDFTRARWVINTSDGLKGWFDKQIK